MFQREVVERKHNFIFSIFFFWKSYRLWDNAEKYSRGRQTPHDSVMLRRVNAIYLLDN